MKSSFGPLILGNWKMNSSLSESENFFHSFKSSISNTELEQAIIGIAPPFTLLESVSEYIQKSQLDIILGSQNVHWAEKGAHTGEISALMLNELNVGFSIIGHSERRALYGESDENASRRTANAIKHNIIPVLCIGENEEEYRSQKTKEVVSTQLKKSLENVNIEADVHSELTLIIAYEPVWAIGTGLSAKPEEANVICSLIKNELQNLYALDIPVLYGGSVDEKNARSLITQESIDGFLVGGASLKPEAFAQIIKESICQ